MEVNQEERISVALTSVEDDDKRSHRGEKTSGSSTAVKRENTQFFRENSPAAGLSCLLCSV
jgi:hypothetical protein